MKRSGKVICISILLIGIFIGGWLFQNQVQKQKVQKESEELYKQYQSAANHILMDLDESIYEQTGNPKDLILTPTHMTFALLERWEIIAKSFPEMEYPGKLIDQGDWLQVSDVLGSLAFTMDEVSIKIGEEYGANPDRKLNPKVVYDCIYHDDPSESYFQKFLEDHGLE